MKRLLCIGCLLLAWLAVPSVAAELIVNGGFETGDFTGWTWTGATDHTYVSCGAGIGHAGSNCYGDMGAVPGYALFSQTLTTVPGQLYDISYWHTASTAGSAVVYWNGNLIDTRGIGGATWAEVLLTGNLATAASTVVTFGFMNVPSYTHVDDLSVVGAGAVPEPSTMALSGLCGLVLVALGRRRARR